jgi:hypothetical protein
LFFIGEKSELIVAKRMTLFRLQQMGSEETAPFLALRALVEQCYLGGSN